MPVYSNVDENISDEDFVRQHISDVPVGIINKGEESTQFAREQRRKKQYQEAQLEHAQMMKRLELQEQREIDLAKIRNEQDLKALGYWKYGGYPMPGQLFYDLDKPCIWGCDSEVAYISPVNRTLRPSDSLILPFDTSHGPDEHQNYRTIHICESLPQQQRAVISTLLGMIKDLNIRLAPLEALEKRYMRMPVAG